MRLVVVGIAMLAASALVVTGCRADSTLAFPSADTDAGVAEPAAAVRGGTVPDDPRKVGPRPRPGTPPTPTDEPGPAPAQPPTPAEPKRSDPDPDADHPAPGEMGVPGPPRVLLMMHGSNDLANDDSLDRQWSSVRDSVDGVFNNRASVSPEEQLRIWQKIATRNVLGVTHVSGSSKEPFSHAGKAAPIAVERLDPSLRLKREAVAIHTSDPAHWDGLSVADAERHYVSGPDLGPEHRQPAVYSGWGVRHWIDGGLENAAARRVARDADGMFIECLGGICLSNKYRDGFIEAMKLTRAEKQPFVLFYSFKGDPGEGGERDSGELESFQNVYQEIRELGLWRTGDAVVVVNYQGHYPLVPETRRGQAADTSTGMLHWAMQQNW